MQSTMIKAIIEDFGNGGTIDGDLVITGDLQVNGGGSLSFDEIIEGTQVIDVTSNLKYSKRHLTKRKAFYKEQSFKFQVTKVEYK